MNPATEVPTPLDVARSVGEPVLEVRNLTVEFATRGGSLAVVQNVDIAIEQGEVHAVVGESGSGKSVTALAIMGLLPERTARVSSGEIRFRGRDLTTLNRKEMRNLQGREIAMVFQEPMTSLNPAFTVGDQIAESVRHHVGSGRRAASARAIELLDEVGIPQAARRAEAYPHEFSGGMRQRVMIAMALACEPDLLIADEPTTALDVTIQAQIVELIRRLSRDRGTSVMFITHDFGVVAEVADNVTVMYAAEVIESADVFRLFESPQHPYTAALLHAVPSLDEDLADDDDRAMPGVPPNPTAFPPACRFAPRCVHVVEGCHQSIPQLLSTADGRRVRCLRADELTLTGRS
ncbi:MAG TPA: ABC transporter ATP-binding protein [Ilumatobacter sp.]|nr:ABC transporter ATP-binding protein [Ilumatobacter sp.]